MVILGIDPGYAIVGWGAVQYNSNNFKVIDYGAVTTPAHTEFTGRLEQIYLQLDSIIKQIKPGAISMEKLFYNTNAKTVIDVAQARGVIALTARLNKIQIFEYTPLQIKQSVTGYGRADKRQVQELTKIILNLKSIPKPDDTADALAVAICHAHSSGSLLGRFNGVK
ncbi:MAG: crossover junction endodeoxyribonuclease RuvC [Clostridiales bacterium]|nr:crossover junction endodeoxyribonuclease RuvC [Clostridiales bacterium]